ncbi:DUF1631 domain-containing protein [Massilia sp. H6]|uniref:DUF1631 domain-containing protein n=1 Tax=Massilia sp. H6 TaxID=2970464 RepID=UPI002167D4A5|nr:DUF1631 domain-containing protein [Massilia sp. H6]UVW27301.1 DUF1631 domain-containing protein [Massilia sp. H6]
MSSIAAQTAPARTATATRRATLDELVGTAVEHASNGLTAMAARMAGALHDMSTADPDPHLALSRIRSGNLLKDNAYAFVHLASTGIEAALRREAAQLLPAAQQAPAPVTLSLIPLEEMDSQLAFAAISRPFDLAHAEALASLGVRLGMLLGRTLVRASHNPFRPDVFLRAIERAWCEFEPDPQAHRLILPLLRSELVLDLGALLATLNDRLKPASAGRQAHARFAKTDDGAAARAARARRDAAVSQQLRQLFGTADPAPGDALAVPMIANLPQGSGGWRPSGAAGFAAPAAAAPAQGGQPTVPAPVVAAPLLGMLEQGSDRAHEGFYLPRLKQKLPQGSLSRGDETTLDLLSRIFETVLLDDAIGQETRDLIAFLQVPVLKAALHDRSFFFEETHPARRMLDLLSRAGWEQTGNPDDPVYHAMRRGVEQVRLESRPDAFAAAVAELEASLAERERAQQAAIAGPIAQATRHEKQAASGRSARKAVALRLAGEEVVAVVATFLEQRWIPVLSLAYTIEDSKPGAIDSATRAMDDLVWSVKPKATQQARKSLIARLPALLATLNQWLDAVQWQDAERLQFFAELAECHAAIVRAPLELAPERQFELAVEAAQQDALRRIAREQGAATDDQVAPDAVDVTLATLARGMRVEFTGGGGVRKLKLAWVSPLRSLFIFSDAGRQEAFSLPAERLAAALRSGSIRVLTPEGVVGRVLTQAAGAAAMNDPAGAARAG